MNKALFAIRLKNLMLSLGLDQARFADLCGLTPAALSMILNGKRIPSLETMDKIHMATGVSIDYLMGIKLGQKKGSSSPQSSSYLERSRLLERFRNK